VGAEVYLAVADAEFSADVFPVKSNGFRADAKLPGNVLGAFARSDKP
jgi:hypothetical protein